MLGFIDKYKKLNNKQDNHLLDHGTLKVVILASAIIIIAVLLTGVFSYIIARNAVITKLKSRDLQYIAESITDKIDGRIQRAKETANILANDPVIENWISGYERDKVLGIYVSEKLADIKKSYDYDNSFIVSTITNHYWDENGKIIDTMSQKDTDDSWFFNTIISKKKISISIDFNKERNDTFAFINSLVGDINRPVAVAGVGLNFRDISKQFRSYRFGDNSNMWLVDKKGDIYISEDIDQTGNNLTGYIPENISKQLFSRFANKNKLSNVMEYKNDQGITYDLICLPLDSVDWSLVLQIPRSESIDIVKVIKLNTFIACFITTILIILLFYFVTGRVANPYKRAVLLAAEMEKLVEDRTLELSEKNSKLTDSIEYARMIQMSVLPSDEKISHTLNNYFIIWKPRDIVGGDFYYIKHFESGSVIFIGDCTGHGVPGALMTMAVNSILNHIVNEEVIKSPGKLLKETSNMLKQVLYGRNPDSLINDGLDAGIIYLPVTGNVTFSGAKLDLYVRDASGLERYKGNPMSIGYKDIKNDLDFVEYNIEISNESVFYLTTDGFLHQNGGDKNSSFGRKRYEALIDRCFNLKFDEQKNIFENELIEYMGEQNQRDDILVLAFKK